MYKTPYHKSSHTIIQLLKEASVTEMHGGDPVPATVEFTPWECQFSIQIIKVTL